MEYYKGAIDALVEFTLLCKQLESEGIELTWEKLFLLLNEIEKKKINEWISKEGG